jgi:ATP-dependent protease HslVU (ClpYQ) peptidase subunit
MICGIGDVVEVEAHSQSSSQVMGAGSGRRYAVDDLEAESWLSNAVK